MPLRVKGMMVLAKLLGETARMMGMGELASSCSNKKLLEALEKTDQMSMCEGVLRLVVYWGPRGASEVWDVLEEARGMLAEIQSLDGREKESGLLRKWAQEQGGEDGEAKAFWEYAVLNPVRELAGMAVEIMDRGEWNPERFAAKR
jgi:SET and MYND domain-containing protein